MLCKKPKHFGPLFSSTPTLIISFLQHNRRRMSLIKWTICGEYGSLIVACLLLGYRELFVPKNVGLSHHFRACEFGGVGCTNQEATIDRSLFVWGNRLKEETAKTCFNIFQKVSCWKKGWRSSHSCFLMYEVRHISLQMIVADLYQQNEIGLWILEEQKRSCDHNMPHCRHFV